MKRRVVQEEVLCDRCHKGTGKDVEAVESVRITFLTGGQATADLCLRHLAVFKQLLGSTKRGGYKRRPAVKADCIKCGMPIAPQNIARHMAKHAREEASGGKRKTKAAAR